MRFGSNTVLLIRVLYDRPSESHLEIAAQRGSLKSPSMATPGRIIAGLVGVTIAGLFLIAGLLSEFALETGLAFVGALIGVWLSGAMSASRKWSQVVGAAIVGIFGAFMLYHQVGIIPRTLPWLLGFGVSNGLIYGTTLVLVARAVRGVPRISDESSSVSRGSSGAFGGKGRGLIFMRFDEDALRERNPWKSVSEAPDLPFRTFAEFQAAVARGSYALDVSYIAARELAPHVRSVGGQLLNMLLTTAWLVVIVGVIAAGVLSGRYLLFLGVPVAVVGHILGNPLNPLRVPMTWLNVALAVALLITVLNSYAIPAALLAAFVLSFSANRAMYASNVRALRLALIKSEALFLNQYSKGGLRLRSIATTPMKSGYPE